MKIKTIALLAAAGVALAACHNKADDAPVAETNVTNMVEEPADVTNVVDEAPPATHIDNTASVTTPPSATLTADEQTLDDADASGMTAKVNRDDAGNTAQPVK
ncbi:MAG: hypothetical protein KF730_06805 [Sphingomonas sp.]|uniref:hypothetical protein n=1 Tax=Sphingomonas sp. TaxID=28214 RepID=UPI0025CC4B27|nr:hypothetical protein [Sphingomonas sp.]MBX3564273.1 hypothetical protein [Sphingomonas sp.]